MLVNTTYCPELWKSITIDNRGNAYSCCLIKPTSFGNIYRTELKQLVNMPEIISERADSLSGTLRCYSECNWVDKDAPASGRQISCFVDYDKMSYIHLNFGEWCNIACVMCKQRARYHKNPWILNSEAIIKNVDIGPFSEIVIQGGEPLFIPECLEYMRYLGGLRKKYTLLTNGLLINDEMAEVLSRDAKIVCISLNAATKETHELVNRGSGWEAVLGNIRRLIDARDRNSSDMEIWGRMTITNYSLNEIPLYLKTWRDWGFDHINFGYDRETVPAFLRDNPQVKIRLQKEVTDSVNIEDQDKLDIRRLKQLGLVDEGI